MPRKPINDYFFYKIVNINADIELIYVGSTANWKERQRNHRIITTNVNDALYTSKLYRTIREHGGWCEFKMVEIGYVEQLTYNQAHQLEEEYRLCLSANMNTKRCFLTPQEAIDAKKNYHIINKDAVKQNRLDNRDEILKQKKEYRVRHNDKINSKARTEIKCVCGSMTCLGHKARHEQTKKHKAYLQSIINN
tara:strand:+ start:39 stop:617 length:579 start_codon:yes stop_codon:yes gene_type:complete